MSTKKNIKRRIVIKNKKNGKKTTTVLKLPKINEKIVNPQLFKRKILIGLFIFSVSVGFVTEYILHSQFAKHQPTIEIEQDITESVDYQVEQDPILIEIQKLYEENNDLAGWIQIDDTTINYPVMYTKGEDYYLRRDFYKRSSTAGTLYINKNNTIKPKDINLIIYGHNMDNGTMFADLLNYKNEDYYQEHKKIIYYTLEEKEEYEIIAVFLSKIYNVSDDVFKYYKFYGEQSKEAYDNFINNIKELSLYDIDLSATYPEELLTLSTCEYSQKDGRLVVVAKRIR